MVTFEDAISAKFTASLLASITGGLHAGSAPERAVMPYCVYFPVGGPYIETFGNANHQEPTIQFNVIGTGRRAVGVLCEALATAYRNTALTISGGKNFSVIQQTESLCDPDPIDLDESGNEVWRWTVTFLFGVQ